MINGAPRFAAGGSGGDATGAAMSLSGSGSNTPPPSPIKKRLRIETEAHARAARAENRLSVVAGAATTSTDYANTPAMGRARTAAMSKDTSSKLLKKRRRGDTDGTSSSFATPNPTRQHQAQSQRQKQQPRRRAARRSASPSTAPAGTTATTAPATVATTTPANDGGRRASRWTVKGGIVLGTRLVARFGQTEAAPVTTATAAATPTATATATPSGQEPELQQCEALLSLSVHGPGGSVLRVDSCQLCPPSPCQFVCAHARQALRHLVAFPTSFQFVSDPCLALATQAAVAPTPTSTTGPQALAPMASLWKALQTNLPEVVARFYNGAKSLCAAFAGSDAPVVATTAGASDLSVTLACSQCGPACCVHTVRTLEPADDVIDTTLLRARLSLLSRATLKSICVNLCWLTSALPDLDPLRHILTHFNTQQHPIKSISADVIRARALPKEHDIGCAMAPQQIKLALVKGAVIAEVVDTVVRFSPTTLEAACSECGPASGLGICLWCRHVVAAATAFTRAHSKRAVFNAEAIKAGLEAWETLNLVSSVVDVALISGTHQELIATLDQLARCSSPSQTSASSPDIVVTTTTTTTTKRRRTEQHSPRSADQSEQAAAPEILLDLVQVAQRRVSAGTTTLCSPSEEATKAQVVAWLHRRHTARQAAQQAYDTELAAVRAVLTADQCRCVCACDIDDGEACTSDCFAKCNCASRLVPAPSVQEQDTNVLQQVVALLQQAQSLVAAEQVHVALPIVSGIVAATEFTGVFPALDEVVAKACEALVRLPQLDASQCQELAQRLDQRAAAPGMGKAALVAWLAAVGGLTASDIDRAAHDAFLAVIAPKPTAASSAACSSNSSNDHSNSSPACSASHLAALAVHAARTQRLPLCMALCWAVLARRVECEGPFSIELQSALASSLVACAPLTTEPAAGSGSSQATGPVEDLVKADVAGGACAASLSVYTSVVSEVTAVCTVPAALQVLGVGLLKAPGHVDLGRACIVRAATLRAASATPSAAAVADTLSQLVGSTAPKLLADVARPVLARLGDKVNDASSSSSATCSLAQAVSQQRSPSAALVFLNAVGQQPPARSALWQQWVHTCIAADAALEDVIPLIDTIACLSAATATTATTATNGLMTACIAELVVGLGSRRRDTAKAVVAHCLSLQAKLSAESKLLLLQTLAACKTKPESNGATTAAASPATAAAQCEWLGELVVSHARLLVDALPALTDKLHLIGLVLGHSAELATSLAVQCVRAEQDGSRSAAMGHAVNLLASATCRLRSSQPTSEAAAQLCQEAKDLMTSRHEANDLWTVASVCLQLGDHQLALDATVALVAALSKGASKGPDNTPPRSVVVNLVSTVLKAQQGQQQAGHETSTAPAMGPELLVSGLSTAERQALAGSLEQTHPQLASRILFTADTTAATQANATISQLKQRDLTPPPSPSFVRVHASHASPTSPIKMPTLTPKRRRSQPRALDSRR